MVRPRTIHTDTRVVTPSCPCVCCVLNFSAFMQRAPSFWSVNSLSTTKVKMTQIFFCFYFPFLLLFTVSFLYFILYVCLALTSYISAPYLFLLLRPPSVPPLWLPSVPMIFTSSSMFISVLNALPSTVILTVWDWRAKFVSNGMCQFRVLQSRNAHLRRWRTWNKGKTISPSHGR